MTDSLLLAAKLGDVVALKRAIASGVDLNQADSQGWTPLFHAAHVGTTEAVELLINAGADVNKGSETGFTALFSAVLAGHVDAVRVLLNAGAVVAPVQGIELRGYAIQQSSSRHEAILKILDEFSSRQEG